MAKRKREEDLKYELYSAYCERIELNREIRNFEAGHPNVYHEANSWLEQTKNQARLNCLLFKKSEVDLDIERIKNRIKVLGEELDSPSNKRFKC